MLQATRHPFNFALNFTIAFVLALTTWFGAALIANAPMQIGGTIARLDILQDQAVIFVQGHDLTCTHRQGRDRCEFQLEQRPFAIEMTYKNTSRVREVAACRASYREQAIDCKTSYHEIVVGGWQPVVTVPKGLSFTPTQRQSLENIGSSRLSSLAKLGEDNLEEICAGIAIVTGVLMAVSSWVYLPSSRFRRIQAIVKTVVSLTIGFSASAMSGMLWMCLLLSLGYAD